MALVLAIDAGTTGVRTIAFGPDGLPQARAYRPVPQHFPRPGWVEHDPRDIADAAIATLADVAARAGVTGEAIAAIGIANQRETTVVWDRATGRPVHRAIVWQDRRTARRCHALREAGFEPRVRELTGLVLDPYFSATKLEWLLTEGGVAPGPNLAFGTIDAWLVWHLTGGPRGGIHTTEPSNASRTMLFDLRAGTWSAELLDRFGIPAHCLPAVRPSSGRVAMTDPDIAAGLRVPVSGVAGDQQAALFGQACFDPGMTKNTYGTGSFVLMNSGTQVPRVVDGLLSTVAWRLGDVTTYALEGAIFVTGAAIEWLREGLGLVDDVTEIGPLASSVADTGGVVFVPALTGLGSPWWDPHARGAVFGLTRGTTRAHLARAAVEAMAWQTRDVVETMTTAAGVPLRELRVDGGASVMDLLCQFQADVLGVPVRRARVTETTALGAAFLAGLAEGVWSAPADLSATWQADTSFAPHATAGEIARRHAGWQRALACTRRFARTVS
jgi:glycerol kinase